MTEHYESCFYRFAFPSGLTVNIVGIALVITLEHSGN